MPPSRRVAQRVVQQIVQHLTETRRIDLPLVQVAGHLGAEGHPFCLSDRLKCGGRILHQLGEIGRL